jgi:hypothetical protein
VAYRDWLADLPHWLASCTLYAPRYLWLAVRWTWHPSGSPPTSVRPRALACAVDPGWGSGITAEQMYDALDHSEPWLCRSDSWNGQSRDACAMPPTSGSVRIRVRERFGARREPQSRAGRNRIGKVRGDIWRQLVIWVATEPCAWLRHSWLRYPDQFLQRRP